MTPKTFEVTCDLFVLEGDHENRVLYAPLLGFACETNPALVDLLARVRDLPPESLTAPQLASLEHLEKEGLLNHPAPPPFATATSAAATADCTLPAEFAPTQVTLFPTNQCNLRCTYCYAAAGEPAPLTLPFELAAHAIDFVLANARARRIPEIVVGFHGGGEPLHPWPLVQRIVSHAAARAAEEGLKARFHSATNGVLSETACQWIVEHFHDLNISFDGLPEVQDRHRPLVNGRGSFEHVDRTLRFLDSHNFAYGLRSTVSEHNVERLEECLDFITTHYHPRTIQFEPLQACGRCATTGIGAPDPERFAARLGRCLTIAARKGIPLTYSGASLHGLRNSFCGAARDNFAVTPDGYLTTCFEVTSRSDPRSETFFIGRLERDGRVQVDPDRRSRLRSLTVDAIPYCRDCFAKWHCAGDCLTKLGHHDYHGARGHHRCTINRRLLREQILARLRPAVLPPEDAVPAPDPGVPPTPPPP